jgi:hypothetical protein
LDFQKEFRAGQMLHDLQKAVPWIAIFVLSLVAGISATRAARHCLLHREFHIKVGVVHRMDARFLGLSCERSDLVSLRPTVF